MKVSQLVPATLLLGACALHAQGETRAAILLTLPASARALALGEASGAVMDDENALFYNPAQLARVRTVSAAASLQRYIANTTLSAFAIAERVGGGTAALGVQLLDYGSEDEVVSTAGDIGTPTGQRVTAQDIAITAGYGVALGSRKEWRIGTALKWVRQHVANASGSALAVDMGAAYSSSRGWELSAALQNFGSRLTLVAVSAPLPYTWRVSAASPLVRGLLGEALALRAMVEARQSSGGVVTGVLGTEGLWQTGRKGLTLAGRAGLSFRGPDDDRRPLTVGGGLTLGSVTVDYGYEGFDQLGATHRVGVRFAAPSRGP